MRDTLYQESTAHNPAICADWPLPYRDPSWKHDIVVEARWTLDLCDIIPARLSLDTRGRLRFYRAPLGVGD